MDDVKIYTVMTMTKFEKDETTRFPYFGETRVPGFYTEKERAINSVKENVCDIFEACYEFALVEEVYAGMYGMTSNRWFFKYNHETNEYEEIEEPSFMRRFGGFTIG